MHHVLFGLAGILGSMPAAIVVATMLLRAALLPLSLRAYRQKAAGLNLLTALVQAPFVWLLYRQFTHGALGADLTARLIGHPGLLAGWLIVVLLAGIAAWNTRQLPAETPKWLRALPFATVAFAPFVPVAAGIYLVTTGAWTAAERWVGQRESREL